VKTLKFWNGRWENRQHIYIAAYSQADAIRMIEEWLGRKPRGIETEFRVYYSPCWGNTMESVAKERGIWVGVANQYGTVPYRRFPKQP
jgi:hypothetical protein